MAIDYVNGVPWGKARFWYDNGELQIEGDIISETNSGGFMIRDKGGIKRVYEVK